MHTVVGQLEREPLAQFKAFAETLSARFPRVKAEVYSQSVGALSEYQGHQIVIDCLLAEAPAGRPDDVASSVSLRYLTARPEIGADVCRGHPSGHVEAEFSPEPLEIPGEVLSDLYAGLSRLCRSLREAVERGGPGA